MAIYRALGESLAGACPRPPPCYIKSHRIRGSLTHWTFRMNKAELVADIAERAELTKADAGRALDALIDSIGSALKKGDAVMVVGFGTFQVRTRAARDGRNPRTGESLKIAAATIPAFKPGAGLKALVNTPAKKKK